MTFSIVRECKAAIAFSVQNTLQNCPNFGDSVVSEVIVVAPWDLLISKFPSIKVDFDSDFFQE